MLRFGRKGMGKSRLLAEFSENKRAVYLHSVRKSYYEILLYFFEDVSKFCGREIEVKDLSHLMGVIEELCSE